MMVYTIQTSSYTQCTARVRKAQPSHELTAQQTTLAWPSITTLAWPSVFVS